MISQEQLDKLTSDIQDLIPSGVKICIIIQNGDQIKITNSIIKDDIQAILAMYGGRIGK